MSYFLDLFSPDTYEAFGKSDRTVSGFRPRHWRAANRVHTGDKLICYVTRLSRWIGVLEVESRPFRDNTPGGAPCFLDSVDRQFVCSSLREKPAQIDERGSVAEG